ncbi:hypothetical protein DTO271G3_1211 [Paecilomyces variotii]|nr:hypothetical protein DTO271G3_1211 [Paecilomyces variotii]
MSSLTRAFTKRNKRPEVSAPMPYREGIPLPKSASVRRPKISGPMNLISTTNMLAYNAPDLPSAVSSSSSSIRSGDESDVALTPNSFASPITSPSITSDETSPLGPEPNHLTSYFPKRSATVSSTPRSSTSSTSADAPAVPKRALSHTKRSHQELARKRSMSRMSPPPNSLRTVRSSQDFFQPIDSASHPFSRELEQVNEVVEDFGGSRVVLDEEEQILLNKGLKKFSVEDYITEIEELYGSIFNDQLGPVSSSAWL